MRNSAAAAGLLLLRGAATALIFASGFSAVSDDDFARLVIAQRLALAPTLDPSGTSWLPLPFYVYGAAFAAFGTSLMVARAVAVTLSLGSVLCVWRAALLLGLSERAAALAGALVALLRSSLYLGSASVPEVPSAALCVLAAACLSGSSRTRLLGAAAVFAACACRYEPWAVAAVYVALCLWDFWKTRERTQVFAALVAAAFPLAWLLHGLVRHGNPTFFVARVAAYRAALGPLDDLSERLLRAPSGLLFGEPELMLAFCCVGLPLWWLTRGEHANTPRFGRFAAALAAIVLFLVLGDVRGAAPTHHASRALLGVWFGAAVFLGWVALRVTALPELRLKALIAAFFAVAFGARLRAAQPREPFADRDDAVHVGQQARRLGADKLAIDSRDFSFFAVQAGFGRPDRTQVLCDHDPRHACASDLLLTAPPTLRQTLLARGASHLASTRVRTANVQLGTVVARSGDWELVQLSNE